MAAPEFNDIFDDLVRTYANLPGTVPMSDEEICGYFYVAISEAVPEIQGLNSMAKYRDPDGQLRTEPKEGVALTLNQMKNFLVEREATKIQSGAPPKAALQI